MTAGRASRLFERGPSGGLWLLPEIPGEAVRVERVIAAARLCLTAIAFFAVDVDSVPSDPHAVFARTLLLVYAAHSIITMIVLRTRPPVRGRLFAIVLHAIDVIAAAAVTLPLTGAMSSFLAFYLFVLAAAAFRWSFRETALTTLVAVAFVVVQAEVTMAVPVVSVMIGGHRDLGLMTVRSAYIVMMGLLLGYMARENSGIRNETAAIVGLLGKIRVDAGLTRVLDVVSTETRAMFKATRLLLVVEDLATRRLYRFDTGSGWAAEHSIEENRPAGGYRQRFLPGPADETVTIVRRLGRGGEPYYQITALDGAGHVVSPGGWTVPSAFATAYPFERLVSVPVHFGDEWAGRLFVFDSALALSPVATAHFLQTLERQVSPAVFNVHLLDQLRSRAGAVERARVARELHDGVIQSLIGVEMQMQALRGHEAMRDSPVAPELARLQRVVHDEVLNLRELMQQMRPPEIEPDELVDYLATLVERFGRDAGITARFISDLREVLLPRHVCFELARIVQEGLVNVRKHSAASRVLVRLNARDGAWILEIEDDGKGFPFGGRLADGDLDANGAGPVIITERVKAIGGRLAITSTPGRGARLEVLVPQETHD